MRILVVHSKNGFLDLVKRVLGDAHEVEVTQDYRSAADHLAAGEVYDAVLCGIEKPAEAIEIFERALAGSSHTRLIPIAENETAMGGFWEQWNQDTRRKRRKPGLGKDWLRRPCTAGEILALCRVSEETPARKEAETADSNQPAEMGAHAGKATGKAVWVPETDAIIDGYRLVCVIGRGGFGTMWLGVNEATGRRVAVKFVEGEDQVPQELAALRKYVHVATRNEHLLRVEHIDYDGVRLCLVTALADSLTGGDTPDSYKALSLANQLQARGHLPEKEAANIALCLARGLWALHRAGLLHGDVAPGNVLSVSGHWVLGDPGLVRFLGEPGICRNQRYYPKPQPVRQTDDLYAVGVILWELTSGVAEMVSGQERLRLDGNMLQFLLRSELPLAKIICRAVAEDPEQRYMNAEEMLQDLQVVLTRLGAEPSVPYALYNLPKLRSLRTNGALPPQV